MRFLSGLYLRAFVCEPPPVANSPGMEIEHECQLCKRIVVIIR